MSYKNNVLKIITLATLILAPISLQAAQITQATTWMAIGATNAWSGNSEISEFTFGGATFTDGQFNTDYSERILTSSVICCANYRRGGGRGEMSYSFNDWSIFSSPVHDFNDMTAPQIDLSEMRANFSSLVFTVWDENGTAYDGWDIGNPGWVPIIDNGNNTFSASWITPAPRNKGDNSFYPPGDKFSITFMPTPVPMPASILLLCSALLILFSTLKKPYNRATGGL
ncbi:MAG: hypothetical protein L3J70_09690 [Gammaproteobacteria bacterium]|nr:hypothetical protein [Gammaproteobacteria bacterium]